MPSYVVLINWTDHGRTHFTHTVQGYRGAQEALAELGVSFKAIYWTLGPYDLIGVIDAADDETAAAAMLSISSPGGIRIVTLRAFSIEEMGRVLATAETFMDALSAEEGSPPSRA